MNKRNLNLFSVFIAIFSYAYFANQVQAKEMTTPQVFLYYAQTFDEVCSNKLNYSIAPGWQDELMKRMPAWQTLWDHEGELLLKTSIKIAGKPYPESSYKAALSLCSFPSMSAPLIVNSRYALDSFTKTPISNEVFISTVFHELLHTYIDSFLHKNTPLLEKYKSESKGVVNHLHLLALEKGVYLKLGWGAKLKAVIAKDESLPNKDYKRAWQIINEKQNYLHFIFELRSGDD